MMPPLNLALVTGAAGFVGRRLCRDLNARGVRVRALDLAEAPGPWDEIHAHDLTRPLDLAPVLAEVDTVFHLAGLAHSSLIGSLAQAAYRELNVEATRHLVAAATRCGVARFLFLSSVKALGEGDQGLLDDDSPPRPTSDYGRSKLEAEQIVLEAGRRTGMHVAVIRSALIYGAGVKGNLREMVEAVTAGRFPPLAETGNRRSLIDVRDVTTALWLAATEPAANGRAYIVTDGQLYSTRRILDAIRRGLNRSSPRLAVGPRLLRPLARLGDLLSRATRRAAPYNSDRHARLFGSAAYRGAAIARELGFQPRYVLEDVAGDMIASAARESRASIAAAASHEHTAAQHDETD